VERLNRATESPGRWWEDAPSAPVLIYDGDCGFCSWWVAVLAPRVASRARLQPYQTTDLRHLGVRPADAAAALQWVPVTGRPLTGAQALAAWLASGRQPWRLVGVVLSTRGISDLAQLVYRRVARVRHSIPGPWQRCPVSGPTPHPTRSSPDSPADPGTSDRPTADSDGRPVATHGPSGVRARGEEP